MEPTEFPPNNSKSRSGRDNRTEPKNIERVTTGEVLRKKRSLRRQLSDVFIAGNMRSAATYVVMSVLLPAARDMLFDAASEGAAKLIFGDKGRRRGSHTTPQSGATGYINYSRYSRPTPYGSEPASRTISRQARARHDFDEIVLATRAEAEQVLDRLYDVVSRYESATVADLYDLVGLSSNHTDHKWGWTYLRGSGVSRTRDGYVLDLPDPEPLD